MNQSFYDDSSRAMGMDHAATAKVSGIARWKAEQDVEYERALRSIGIACDEHGVPQVQHIVPDNAGAHDMLALLLAEGWRWKDALDALESGSPIAALETVKLEADAEREDVGDGTYLGASVESLMKASVSPDKCGSRSRSKKSGNGRPDPLAVQTSLIRRMAA